jgi:hypothetical protein
MTAYASDNREYVVSAKPDNVGSPTTAPFVQIALFAPNINSVSATGIALQTNGNNLWSCPNIPGLPWPDLGNDQWLIGYQYLGGFTSWTPPRGTIAGTHSPVKLSQSQPYWCMAADLLFKVSPTWGAPDTDIPAPTVEAYKHLPQHREGNNRYPEGGNEVFTDGSALFCKIQTMYQFTTWSTERQLWFYQRLTDITDPNTIDDINGTWNLKWSPANQ